MSGTAWTVNSEHTLAAYQAKVADDFKQHKYVTYAPPKIGAARSLTSNALSHIWYNFADKMLSDKSGDNRRYCKLHFGVPMLRAEDPEFRAIYNQVIINHDYETKLKIMDYLPITSTFTREQMSRYLDQVQMHYAIERQLVLESKGEFAEHQRKQECKK